MQCGGHRKWSKDNTFLSNFEYISVSLGKFCRCTIWTGQDQVNHYDFYSKFYSNYEMLSRLQDKTSTFKGPMDVLRQIVRKEGLLGLYAGMESTFWRWALWHTLIQIQLDDILFRVVSQTRILERRIFWLHSSSQIVTSKTRCSCYAFLPRTGSKCFIISAEPTSTTHEQLRVRFHRWFCRYRIKHTVSHSAISRHLLAISNMI